MTLSFRFVEIVGCLFYSTTFLQPKYSYTRVEGFLWFEFRLDKDLRMNK
jgi:hypothetical protein